MQLGEIAKANHEVAIGSYPFFDPQHGPNTNVVLRAHDAHKLGQAKRAVEGMLERVRRAGEHNQVAEARGLTANTGARRPSFDCPPAILPLLQVARRLVLSQQHLLALSA